MKSQLLTISFLLTLSIQLVAQVPFATDNAVWTNTQYTYTFNPPNPIPESELTSLEVYCVNGVDTTIQSEVYTKVYHCLYLYKGAIREENSVVYFVPADSSNEYLLYDFGAQVGQTLTDVFVGFHNDDSFMLQDFTVQQTDTEIIGGVSRRVVYVDQFRWIEGIGCETGLFMEPWTNVSMYENRLECFSMNDQMIYPNSGTEPCPYVFVGMNGIEDSSDPIAFYPNPTDEAVTISFDQLQSNVQISVTNDLGQEVKQFTLFDTDRMELLLEGASGLYYVNVTFANGSRRSLRIIKK
jgi:hypothetical protein